MATSDKAKNQTLILPIRHPSANHIDLIGGLKMARWVWSFRSLNVLQKEGVTIRFIYAVLKEEISQRTRLRIIHLQNQKWHLLMQFLLKNAVNFYVWKISFKFPPMLIGFKPMEDV